jgi:hypothetical protein
MKVTKAKSLNTIWPNYLPEGSVGAGQRALDTAARSGNALEAQYRFDQKNKILRFPNSRLRSLATSETQIVFGPFALVTFIWASK